MIDIVIVGLYLLASFIFGIFANKILKTSTSDEEGYFLAGRKMPGWLNGISFAVTSINADVAPVYVGIAVVVGLPVCWFYLSKFTFAYFLAGMLFYARWRNLGVYTGPEFFKVRFGGRVGTFVRMYSSAFSVCFGMIPWIGAGLLGIHMIFSPFLGFESKSMTLLIILPILILYVWISGFAGVLIADFVQTLVILISSLVLLAIVLIKFGGPSGLAQNIIDLFGQRSGDILSVIPSKDSSVLNPLIVIAWLIIPTLGIGGNVGFEGQRVISAKSSKEAVKVSVWTTVSLVILLLVITLPSLGALVHNPDFYNAEPFEREQVYGVMLREFLPVGLRGLALAALAAAVMSTISSHLSYGAQTIVNDIVHPIFKGLDRRKGVWIGRLAMLVMMVGSIAVVYYSKSLLGIAITVLGVLASVNLVGWAQWWWWRTNIYTWLSANICGPIIYFVLGYVLSNFPWWQERMAQSETMQQQLALFKALIAIVLNAFVWVTVTLLTQPHRMEVLKEFYKRAKPLGYWKPVSDELLREGYIWRQPRGLIAGGLFVAVVGVIWTSFLIMGLSKLYVGQYLIAVAMFFVMAAFAYWFKRLFSWHMRRLEM
jgi:solute:Na+ symporter, SSS family